jgi:hypothetical protein
MASSEGGDDHPLRLAEVFINSEWAAGPLSRHNILDYFCASPFFAAGAELDRGDGGAPAVAGAPPPAAATSTPSSSTSAPSDAVVYSLRPPAPAEEAQGLFVIEKRVGGVISAVYCALGDQIVQAPPLRELILSRAGRAAAHLSAALETLRQLEEAV